MIYDGDIESAKKLVNPAKKVINKGSSISYEPFEKRVQLWNEIKQNLDSYEDGECGKLLDDLDRHYQSLFDVALLVLARSFKEKDEDFPQSEIFRTDELNAYDRIEKYNVFEINTKDDIKKKVIAKDNNFLDLLEDYYVHMDSWVEETVENSEMRLTLRYYLRKKWGEYKKKINQAVNELNQEYDWLGTLINEWKSKAETQVEQMTEEIKVGFHEKEQDMQKIIDEIKGMKEKVDAGSRFVEIGEAKFYEHNFIGRTKNKLHEKIELSGMRYKVKDVAEYPGADVSQYSEKISEESMKNLPENRYVMAKLTPKKLFGKKPILLKAAFCSRVDRFASYGVDTDPLELVDVNPYISTAMDETKNERMLLFLASPTGFAKEVEDHIAGDEFHKNFLSVVSVCLLDLETDKLSLNPHDKTAEQFKEMFVLQTDEEKTAKAKNDIEDILMERGHVRLDQAIKACGDKKLAKKIFYGLKDEKGYKVRGMKEIGLVLVGE